MRDIAPGSFDHLVGAQQEPLRDRPANLDLFKTLLDFFWAPAIAQDNDLAIESYRAHALMFLGRGEDAKALYLFYKGKLMSEDDSKVWERAIAEDFAEFRKAGLTHPMMAEIEKELGVSP